MAPTVRVLHEPSDRDVRALSELIERTAAHDHHRPIGEHALVELKQGERALPHAAFAAVEGDELVGYAHLSERETPGGWRLEAFVAPERRGERISRALISAVLEHVAEHGGGRIQFWAYRPGAPQARLASAFGMTMNRRLFQMSRTLPAPGSPLPEGVTVRSFEPSDGRAWIGLHNEVFALHPDGGGWRAADLAWHLEEPWFDPGGFLLASDASGLAGYIWMKPEPDGGSVYFLGVSDRWRGRRLAEGLLCAGMRWALGRGGTRVSLYVDEQNGRAVALYRRAGFEVAHEDHGYTLDVPARALVP
jgi:mycothiol synthase